MTPAERNARSIRFRAMMQDGEVGEAFDDVEAEYTKALVDGRTPEERERFWLAIQVLRKVRQQIVTVISDGRLPDPDKQALARIR